ncbi:FMN-linked oxidoreductase [Exidia glandulosa HHB12029]|uniref:FMN-linked oxidoreductase n=1 Tax=Exidia glandulosa HHB12029 TaxID=1314781 RepID=A0A165JP76_EXIGL|nr:FMN-linked oxidoreductase [Exidia glandulosa HHB12029]
MSVSPDPLDAPAPATFDDERKLIFSPATLPCGRVVKNRLAKASMYENMADFPGGPPTPELLRLYELWAIGGWGIILTGNVQISTRHRGLGRDLLLNARAPSKREHELYTAMADGMKRAKQPEGEAPPLVLMQINHAGRQSPNFLGGRWPWQRPLAPSPRRVGEGTTEGIAARIFYRLLWQTPQAMTLANIEDVKNEFIQAALFAQECNYDGVQVHAAHGYMLAQFLSPATNSRTDKYKDGVLIVKEICTAIRAAVKSSFVVGVKLNAVDYTSGGLTEELALEHVKTLAACGIDFIEVSGGSYEAPAFTEKASPRQAFFANFSRAAHAAISTMPPSKRPLVMLTGGLRTSSDIARCLRAPHADIAGLARPAAIDPAYPRHMDKTPAEMPDMVSPKWFPKLVIGNIGTAWHCDAMRAWAIGKPVQFDTTSLGLLMGMFIGPAWKTQIVGVLVILAALKGYSAQWHL